MGMAMMPIVSAGQDDQTDHSCERGEDCKSREDFLEHGRVSREAVGMSQPALGDEGVGEGDDGDCAHGDEKGLELMGANI